MDDAATRTRSVATAHDFPDLLEAKDIVAWAGLWTEDAVRDMPFAPEGFPRRVDGRTAPIDHHAPLPGVTGRVAFEDGVAHPTLDPSGVSLEHRGRIQVLPTGRDYDDPYAGLFRLDAVGRITLLHEHLGPRVPSDAWNGAPVGGFGPADG